MYGPQGLRVWALSDEPAGTLEAFRDTLGVQMPILLDEKGATRALYEMSNAFPTAAYPQEWLIGRDGTVVYFNNAFEYEGLTDAIEGALGD